MRHILLAAALALSAPTLAQDRVDYAPQLQEGDAIFENFAFDEGGTLDLRIHYATLGTPKRDADGNITNAVMISHGTTGSGRQFLADQFAQELYGPGQPLDLAEYYLILVDNIGHGQSSKPSDGLRMDFPDYRYSDMVRAQGLLMDRLGIETLRLYMGTSMGCMHGFVWATTQPERIRAMMPMACLPTRIAGHNRMWRKAAIHGIQSDPAWNGGNYEDPPEQGLRAASSLLALVGLAPVAVQQDYPDPESADGFIVPRIEGFVDRFEANDFIYQFQSSYDYDPWPHLEKADVPMTWVNSADDYINPPGYGLAETAAERLPDAKYVLIPESTEGKGHSTHTWAKFWKDELVALLERTED